MKKIISKIATIVFIISAVSLICGMAALERVRPLVKKIAVEKAVNNNVVDFIQNNLELLKLDDETIRDTLNNIEIIDTLADCYVDAALQGIRRCKNGKIDIEPYLNKTTVDREFTSVIKKIVYAVIEIVDANPDFKDKLIINQVISFGASKITDMITREVNRNLKEITLRIKIEVKLYFLIQNLIAKIILAVLAFVSFLALIFVTDKNKKLIQIGRTIAITGGSALLVLIYNILRSNYKIKKLLGFSMKLGLEKYLVISGIVLIAGLVLLTTGIISNRRK